MPHQLMAHTTVADDPERQAYVFQYRLMAPADQISDELFCGVLRGLHLGLVASPPGHLDFAEQFRLP